MTLIILYLAVGILLWASRIIEDWLDGNSHKTELSVKAVALPLLAIGWPILIVLAVVDRFRDK